MLKLGSLIVLLGLLTACATSSNDEVVITDDCQADIRTLKREIYRNRDPYTLEARTRTNDELLQAKTNRFNHCVQRDALTAPRRGFKRRIMAVFVSSADILSGVGLAGGFSDHVCQCRAKIGLEVSNSGHAGLKCPPPELHRL
ncbi:MAG: hypothetical protein R3215_04125 [Halomonas sp.]|nr:hypothetical protein [Halomonas sp.]